jgi:hypothetical protein
VALPVRALRPGRQNRVVPRHLYREIQIGGEPSRRIQKVLRRSQPENFFQKRRRPEKENSHVLLRKKETRKHSDVTIVVIAKKVVRKETVIVLCGLRLELVELFGRRKKKKTAGVGCCY